MYNKNQFKKVNDKKVLHKIKKHWAVLSVALLGLISGGALTTTNVSANTNADNQSNNSNNQSNQQVNTNQLQKQQPKLINNQINQNNGGKQNTQNINTTQNNQFNSSINPNTSNSVLSSQGITTKAKQIHSHIMNHALTAQQKPVITHTLLSDSNSTNVPTIVQTGKWDNANVNYYSNDVMEVTGNGTINASDVPSLPKPNDSSDMSYDWELKINKNNSHIIMNNSKNGGEFSANYHPVWKYFNSMDLSGLDTSHITNMNDMFENDSDLNSLNVNRFNTNNVTNMNYMFSGDRSLNLLDLSSFDTRKASMINFFGDYNNINSLPVKLPAKLKIGPFTQFHNGVFQFGIVTNINNSYYKNYNSQNNNPQGSINSDVSDTKTFAPNIPINSVVLSGNDKVVHPSSDIMNIGVLENSNGTNVTSEFKNGTESPGTYYVGNPTVIELNNQDNQSYPLLNAIYMPSMNQYSTSNSDKINVSVPGFNYNKAIPQQLSNIIKSSLVFNNDLSVDKKQNYNVFVNTSNTNDIFVNINVNENYAKFIHDAGNKVNTDMNNAKQYQSNQNSLSDITSDLTGLQNDSLQAQHYLTEPVNWNTTISIGSTEDDANNYLSNIISDARNDINNDYSAVTGQYGIINDINRISNDKNVKTDPNVTSGINNDKSIAKQASDLIRNDYSNPTMSNINNAKSEEQQASNADDDANNLQNQAELFNISHSSSSNSTTDGHKNNSNQPSRSTNDNNQIKTGIYNGLNYEYNVSNQSLIFTSGTLNWDGNHSNNRAFIGTSDNAPSDINNAKHITFNKGINMNNVTSLHNMFLSDTNVQSINLSNLDTSHITNMNGMFENDYGLNSLNVTGFNTGNVTDMDYMFSGTALSTLDLNSFDTRKASMKNFLPIVPNVLVLGKDTKIKSGAIITNLVQNDNSEQSRYSYISDVPSQPYNQAYDGDYPSDSDAFNDLVGKGNYSLDGTSLLMDANGNNVDNQLHNGTLPAGTYYRSNLINVSFTNQNGQKIYPSYYLTIPYGTTLTNSDNTINEITYPGFNYKRVISNQINSILSNHILLNNDYSINKYGQNYSPKVTIEYDPTADSPSYNFINVNITDNQPRIINDANNVISNDLSIAKTYSLNNITSGISRLQKDYNESQHYLSEPVNFNTVKDIVDTEHDADLNLNNIINNVRNDINNEYNDVTNQYHGYINDINSVSNNKDVKADPNVTSGINNDKNIAEQASNLIKNDYANPTMSNVNNAKYEVQQARNALSDAYNLQSQANSYAYAKAHPKTPNIPSTPSIQSEINSYFTSMSASVSASASGMQVNYNNEISSLNNEINSHSTNSNTSTTNSDTSEITSLSNAVNSMKQNSNVPENTINDASLQSSFSNYVSNDNAEIDSLNNKISSMEQTTPVSDANEINSLSSKVNSMEQSNSTNTADSVLQSSYDSYVNSTNAEIDSLSNDVNTSTPTNNASEINSLNDKINSMSQDINTNSSTDINNSSLQSSYNSYVSDTNAEINSLNNKMNGMSQNNNIPMNNNNSALNTYVSDTNNEISSLTNRINTMPQSNPAPVNNDDLALQSSYNTYMNNTNAEINSLADQLNDSANNNTSNRSTEVSTTTPNSDITTNLNQLSIGEGTKYQNGVVTRQPIHYNMITINQTCLLHNHMFSVGQITDYAGVLKRGTVVKIIKRFSFKIGNHVVYRYEINLDGSNYFVTANPTFTTNAYILPTEARKHRRAVITKPCYMYKRGNKRLLHHGVRIHIKRVLHYGKITRLQLTNGAVITANKRFIKLV